MPDLLTTHEVQSLLQVDRTTIYRLVDSGKLPAIRVGKQWRFSKIDIDRWLQAQAVSQPQTSSPDSTNVGNGPLSATYQPTSEAQNTPSLLALRELLPLSCAQLIQDEFAHLLGVMMVITDMDGQVVTAVSNPCGYYTALIQGSDGASQCVRGWQKLASGPAMQPAFSPNEMGLLCARGLIRVESQLKGMVVIGGITPEVWPPGETQIEQLAEKFGLNPKYILANIDGVYRLDKTAQEIALRSVQRIADIFSHIAGDRNTLWGRMQAIASLTTL